MSRIDALDGKIQKMEYEIKQMENVLRQASALLYYIVDCIGLSIEGNLFKDILSYHGYAVNKDVDVEEGIPIIHQVDFSLKSFHLLLDHLGLKIEVDAAKEEQWSIKYKNEE